MTTDKLSPLNIRDIPSEFKRLLKIDAAKEGISLKELCLRRLAVSPAQMALVKRYGEKEK